jgi:thioredoxin-related protein
MKKIFLLAALIFSLQAFASDSTKLYNPDANVARDVAALVKQAKKENKHVILMVGGNWCIWCYRFNNFLMGDTSLKNILDKNYLFYHLNYSKENKNLDYLKKLGFPQRFGFPVMIVLDGDGKQIHTQDSGLLEKEKSYDYDKVKTFLLNWTPDALNEFHYKEG